MFGMLEEAYSDTLHEQASPFHIVLAAELASGFFAHDVLFGFAAALSPY